MRMRGSSSYVGLVVAILAPMLLEGAENESLPVATAATAKEKLLADWKSWVDSLTPVQHFEEVDTLDDIIPTSAPPWPGDWTEVSSGAMADRTIVAVVPGRDLRRVIIPGPTIVDKDRSENVFFRFGDMSIQCRWLVYRPREWAFKTLQRMAKKYELDAHIVDSVHKRIEGLTDWEVNIAGRRIADGPVATKKDSLESVLLRAVLVRTYPKTIAGDRVRAVKYGRRAVLCHGNKNILTTKHAVIFNAYRDGTPFYDVVVRLGRKGPPEEPKARAEYFERLSAVYRAILHYALTEPDHGLYEK